MTDALIRFAATLSPGDAWPRFESTTRAQVVFQDGVVPEAVSNDTYRLEGIALLTELMLENPI